MFRTVLCPSLGVFHCTHSNGICHTDLLTACEQVVSKRQKDLMIEVQGKQKVIRGSNASFSSTLHKISKVNNLTWNCRLFAGISSE